MSFALLICAQDLTARNPNNPDAMLRQGDVYRVENRDWNWGLKEGLPYFIRAYCDDAPTKEDVRQYIGEWLRKLDFSLLNSDLATDTHTFRVTSTLIRGTDGKGKITNAQISGFISEWGLSVVGFGDNYVDVRGSVYGLLTSGGFFSGLSLTNIIFTEQNYIGGTHTIRMNYAGSVINTPARQQLLELYLTEHGATIISHNTNANRLDYSVTRQAASQFLKSELQRKHVAVLSRCRFRIPAAVVDNVIANGGETTVTLAQIQSYVRDKLND